MKTKTDPVQAIRERIRDLIEKETEKLGDDDYLSVLEEVEADVEGMINCKKEELDL